MGFLELTAAFGVGTFIGKALEDALIVAIKVRAGKKQAVAQEQAFADMLKGMEAQESEEGVIA